MKTTDFEKLLEIRKLLISDNPEIRVFPNGTFQMKTSFGKVMLQDLRGTKLFEMSDYKDDMHRGKQGRGYVAWRNHDFETPFTFEPAELCLLNRYTMTANDFEKIIKKGEFTSYGSIAAKKYTEKYV